MSVKGENSQETGEGTTIWPSIGVLELKTLEVHTTPKRKKSGGGEGRKWLKSAGRKGETRPKGGRTGGGWLLVKLTLVFLGGVIWKILAQGGTKGERKKGGNITGFVEAKKGK